MQHTYTSSIIKNKKVKIMSKTSSQVKNRWNEKNYDRITIMVKKGKKAELQEKAKANGFSSLNSYLISCIESYK